MFLYVSECRDTCQSVTISESSITKATAKIFSDNMLVFSCFNKRLCSTVLLLQLNCPKQIISGHLFYLQQQQHERANLTRFLLLHCHINSVWFTPHLIARNSQLLFSKQMLYHFFHTSTHNPEK